MAQASALPNPTQAQQILAWLKSGKTLTPTEALDLFGCFRLGARIWDLKGEGHEISATMKKVFTRSGTKACVAEYSMAPAPKGGVL